MGKIRNPVSFSEYFELDPQALQAEGVLNPILNVDTKLFIDPVLLSKSRCREMSVGAVKTFDAYFGDVVKLLSASRKRGDVAWREARDRLLFPEVTATCLGYGASTIQGRAFGLKLSERLIDTAKEVVELGVTDPGLFKLLPLIEEGVGPDLISDMTTTVVFRNLAALTAALSCKLAIPTEPFSNGHEVFALPRNPEQARRTPILLVPTDVLRSLPVASDWSEVATAAAESHALRDRVSRLIGDIWSAKIRANKARLRAATLKSRKSFEAALALLSGSRLRPYNLKKDPEGLMVWRKAHETIAKEFPLALRLAGPPSRSKAIALVSEIVEQFQKLVEKKGMWRLLWHDEDPHREKVAQMLFYAIADAYCKANNLDVTPEAETGTGPVDFKFSAGYDVRILVEIKLSTNSKLVAGFEKQLGAYRNSEGALSSTYLVVDVGGLAKKEQRLRAAKSAMTGSAAPELVIVDARRKPSASKR